MYPLKLSIGEKKYTRFPTAGDYATVLPDYKRTSDHLPRTHGEYPETIPSIDYIHMKSYGSNVGVPDVINLYDDVWVKLDEKKQWLWMDINCMSQFGSIYRFLEKAQKENAMASYKSLTSGGRAFTNGTAWDNGRKDYVIPENLYRTQVVEQEQLLCSLNKVKVVGSPRTFFSNYLGLGGKNYEHLPIECLDPQRINIPSRLDTTLYVNFVIDIISKDWLCHNPSTSSGKNLGNAIYEINKFPQFGEKSKFLLWGANGVGWIRSDWIRVI